MKKIAILGCENSHADNFLKFIRENEAYSDVEVVGIYSNEMAACNELHDTFGVPILGHYADAAEKIDGLIITARHGDNHYKYAKPYIKSGIPMFIDKPITVSEEDAVAFMKALKGSGTRITGGSSLRFADGVIELKNDFANEESGKTLGGYVRAPYESVNEYGGFYFYAQHLVEMVCEIFGRFPISVAAKKNGSQITVLFHYKSFDCVGLYTDNSNVYFASRMSFDGAKGMTIDVGIECFEREFEEFCKLLNGGAQTITYEEFVSPVFILNAIMRSLESGREEPINEILI